MSDASEAFGTVLKQRTLEFHARFVRVVTFSIAATAVLAGLLFAALQPDAFILSAAVVALGMSGTAYWLSTKGRHRLGAYIFLYGLTLQIGIAAVIRVDEFALRGVPGLLFVVVALAGFLLGVRGCITLAGLSLLLLGGTYARAIGRGLNPQDVLAPGGFLAMMLAVLAVAVVMFARQANEHQQALASRLADIDAVVQRARRVAEGDLTDDIASDDDVSRVVREMLRGLRRLVEQIQQTASSLAAATGEIAAMSTQQEQAAVEQASAVGEIRQTLESLTGASREIAESAQGVLSVSESTLQNNQAISLRISELTLHTRRISEILEVIKDIANKSELLALNASLEGAKAGEAGRGFSLVAGQMQRLAENVMTSVKDVRALTADIRDATGSTVVATETGTKLASEVTQAARQITLVTQQQRSSTEQVTHVMNDVAKTATDFAAGSRQTLVATQGLADMSEQLNEVVRRFRL